MKISADHQLPVGQPLARAQRIFDLRDAVLAEWEHRVRNSVRGADELLTPILINTLPAFFDRMAEALTPGHPRQSANSNSSASAAHGNERARMTGYGPEQVIQEYQIFRDCFAAVARETGLPLQRSDWRIINESIDTGIREAIREFTAMHDGFQRRIAAGLSHDMRTPLSIMLTSAQLLQLQTDPARVSALAQKIDEHGRRLDGMIEELLNALSYHRGQHLPLALTQFDVLPLAQAVCSQFNLERADRCVASGKSVTGWWCENSLRRTLENLISNAVKYGDDNPITVNVDVVHERMILTVHNSGKAIAPEQVKRIFDYLRRENDNAAPGWGIGLPFVQNVAESHGGSVAVDSSAEMGTTFIFDVPVDCRPFVHTPAGPETDH